MKILGLEIHNAHTIALSYKCTLMIEFKSSKTLRISKAEFWDYDELETLRATAFLGLE